MAQTTVARRGRKKKSNSSGRWTRRVRRILFALLFMLVVVSVVIYGWYSTLELPADDVSLDETSFICLADVEANCGPDNAFAMVRALKGEQAADQQPIEFARLPQVVINAVLAAEDNDFQTHSGYSSRAIGRALWENKIFLSRSQGGSTITQQYVGANFVENDGTYEGKAEEFLLSIKFERELASELGKEGAKKEILTRYLNTVYFGRGAYGIEAAARAYYGKGVESLQLHEAAYLAALIRSPVTTDVATHYGTAVDRRDSVLDQMWRLNWINDEELLIAKATPVETGVLPKVEHRRLELLQPDLYGAQYFVEWAHANADTIFGEDLYGRGARVYLTLDPVAQQAAYQAAYDTLNAPGDPAASVVTIDNNNGHVVAMVAGRSFGANQVNLALGELGGGSGRQPGSLMKPIVLAASIEQSISPWYTIPSESGRVENCSTDPGWSQAGGPVTLSPINAVVRSSNPDIAQLTLLTGPENVAEMAHRLGVQAPLEPSYSCSIGLGSLEVSPLDMARAFSTFARSGSRIDPVMVSRVEDDAGNLLWQATPHEEAVMHPTVAEVVNTALRGVVTDGTAEQNVGNVYPRWAAGKTGTTQSLGDAWFTGYTCEYTTSVWIGYPDSRASLTNIQGVPAVYGGTLPAQIWTQTTGRLTEGLGPCGLPMAS